MTSRKSRRFFFNVVAGEDYVVDPRGIAFSDTDAAITAVLFGSKDILARLGCCGAARAPRRFEITDEDGEIVAKVPVR